MNKIELRDVWEKYRIKFIEEGKVFWEDFWALRGINLKVEEGETLAIIGENGAGKTTLLKLIAGLLVPDRGEIKVEGKVSSLFEPGLGFHPELTGKENVYLTASLFGLSKEKIDFLFPQIRGFADIGKFIDSPLKYYSQGMFVRLSFSIAIHINPDILLIDEILAVGDIGFQKKCISKLLELKDKGLTLILVTQDLNLAKKLAKRGIFLRKGEIVKDGPIERVISSYIESIKKEEGLERKEEKEVISAGRLKVLAEDGKIRIFWEDRELTSGEGLYTGFLVEDIWYHSFEFISEVKKINEDALLMVINYPILSLKEQIRIKILNERELDLEITLILDKEMVFLNRDIRLEVSSLYSVWKTPEEEGTFTENYIKEISPVKLKNSKTEFLALKEEDELPSLIFSIFDTKKTWISSLYKKKNKEKEVTVLQVCEVIPFKYRVTPKGENIFFKGKIILNSSIEKKATKPIPEISIKEKGLEFIFEDGKGKVFWKGSEITTGLGFHSSFRHSGIWYDSSLAVWEIINKDFQELELKCSRAYLPIEENWKIKLNNQSILWEIKAKFLTVAKPELMQISLMFNNDYKIWEVEKNRGEFSEEFSEDYDILPFRLFYGKVDELKAYGSGLPLLLFKLIKGDVFFRGMVGNTDSLYKARLFQFQKSKLKNEEFFSGEVRILE